MTDPYELVPYPGGPFRQAHPDRLAVLATLFGMVPAPLERCRVLEVGCGEGGNIIPMAFGLPDSEFLGIDRAEGAIRKGQELTRALEIKNLTLRPLDLLEMPPELGQFDYIITHGLYSWAPPAVQDKILALSKAHLAPRGVAYVSYNVLPGGHLRLMLREMMLFHLRDIEQPGERVRQAQALLGWLAAAQRESDPFGALLKAEAQRSLERRGQFLFHDELGEHYRPVYFRQFLEHAARHGLQYLAEASLTELEPRDFPQQVLEKLAELAAEPVLQEQYLDFLRCRKFRRTLLCHEGVPLDRELRPERLRRLYAASAARPVAPAGAGAVEKFEGPHGAAMSTAHPVAKAALHCLAEAWPQSLGFDELLAEVRRRAGLPVRPEEANALGEILYWTSAAGLVDLHAHPFPCVARAGLRPMASPLARLQVLQSDRVTTLRHTEVSVEGALERQLLLLLDGARDRATLLAELNAFAQASAPERPAPIEGDEFEEALAKLARLALLVA